jgi:hypothetical protein
MMDHAASPLSKLIAIPSLDEVLYAVTCSWVLKKGVQPDFGRRFRRGDRASHKTSSQINSSKTLQKTKGKFGTNVVIEE